MKAIDANLILRYIIKDNQELYDVSAKIIDNEEILIPGEIILEVVYVLLKVYNVDRSDIANSISNILNYPNITIYDKELIEEALSIFASENIDYADALLVSLNKTRKMEVETLDKKILKILRRKK
ncbi:MAG: PIN domain-containing protein [Leptospiraceae bacterium]|nr:PIN domain-containing protein [Leptospiraceae bacterium]